MNITRFAAISGTFAAAAVALTSLFPGGAGSQGWDPLPSVKPKAPSQRPMTTTERVDYLQAIQRTAQMVSDPAAQSLARRFGLHVLNVTWEDTGRYKNSAVGPNISDMTIQVGAQNPETGQFEVTCMPVIRHPNFSDLTGDIDPRFFTLLVGNQKGEPLRRVSLYDFLAEPTRYLTNPNSWLGRNKTLLAARDTHVLVSAQACFLPVPARGIATFNPVIFNYQSYSGDPAVLTILATREGTSVTVIDNKRDAFSTGSVWGQRLFHNADGHRTSLTGQRLSDFIADSGGDPRTDASDPGYAGVNMVLLIQVPLKQKRPARPESAPGAIGGGGFGAAGAEAKSMDRAGSDVETAVIGHGEIEGPFTEIDNLPIERDPNFPIRVTVQFYKATSNGVVSEQDVKSIREQIDRVYSMADYVGSLVTAGYTGRPTEYVGMKIQPRDWWDQFWRRHEMNTGDTREEAIAKLIRLLGKNYQERPVCDLYLRDLLTRKQ